jgi:hypothetical protein
MLLSEHTQINGATGRAARLGGGGDARDTGRGGGGCAGRCRADGDGERGDVEVLFTGIRGRMSEPPVMTAFGPSIGAHAAEVVYARA